jgi:TatD DNase family protein
MKYIDTHCHLNFKDFDEDRDDIIDRAQKNDLGMIQIGTGLKTSKEVVGLAKNYYQKNPNIWSTIGLHPIYTTEESEFRVEEFQKILDEDIKSGLPKIVGVGECGLDYFHLKGETKEETDSEKEVQEKVFQDQIEFAIKNSLPLMIHCRDAYDDVISILKEYKEKLTKGEMGNDGEVYSPERLHGNCHFFAGTIEHAKEFLDMNFTVSFTGVITFAEEYKELVKFVPLELMHAETDSPYVAPVPFRGQKNEPNNVIKVVNRIADIKEVSFEEAEKQLVENAKKLYKLKNEIS